MFGNILHTVSHNLQKYNTAKIGKNLNEQELILKKTWLLVCNPRNKAPLGFAPTLASRIDYVESSICFGRSSLANRRFNEVNPGMSFFIWIASFLAMTQSGSPAQSDAYVMRLP